MILEETLRQIVRTQREDLDTMSVGTERDSLDDIPLDLPYAVMLSGIRRCGKSTLLRQLARRLDKYAYLNLEDPRLAGMTLTDFLRVENVLQEEYGRPDHYLLDEVQNAEKWELFVRAQLDRGRKFVITGSNASLLGRELGAKLTGRHLRKELFPFSFGEFLRLRESHAGAAAFRSYLKEGGFPAFLRYKRPELLRELFNDVISRDVLTRHRVRELVAFRELALYLVTNSAKEVSYRTLARLFHLGSPGTASAYVSYLEDCYLMQTLPLYDPSPKRRVVNPRKIYAIDTGLSSANSTSFSEDLGSALENAVFLHLRRRHRDLFYFKGRAECDFVVREGARVSAAYQVCYDLTEDNREREVGGLMEALDRLGLQEGGILTFDQEDELQVQGKRVWVSPAWKWMQEVGPPKS